MSFYINFRYAEMQASDILVVCIFNWDFLALLLCDFFEKNYGRLVLEMINACNLELDLLIFEVFLAN